MKKFLIVLFTCTSIAILTISIYWYSHANQPKTTGLPLRLGRYYWPGQYWREIADKKGWFKDAGLNVELIDTNPDYFQSIADVIDGKIDAIGMYQFDLIFWNIKGHDLVAVLEEDISSGSEVLVSTSDIQDVYGLKGKTVGVAKNTNLEYLLNIVLKRSGLELSDIIIRDISTEDSADEFALGNIDAFIAWEPFPSLAIRRSGAKKLWDSGEIPGSSRGLLTFKQEFIETRPGDVEALVKVWYKTTEYIKKNPREAYRIIADIYQISQQSVETLASQDKISDLEVNRISFLNSDGFESLHGSSHKTMDFLTEIGQSNLSFDGTTRVQDSIFNNSFISQLKYY